MVMEVRIKKIVKEAVIPTYAKSFDAGMDLTAISKNYDEYGNVVYGTGLAFEIPKGYVGLLFPRSSNANKYLLLSNSVGVLDSGYRGEVLFKFKFTHRVDYMDLKDTRCCITGEIHMKDVRFGNRCSEYQIGDRIGQLLIIPYPEVTFKEVDELSETERGENGYGHTGK